MPVQRDAVKLREHKDASQTTVDAVAHRNIDDPVFASERDCRLGALFGEREEPGSGAAAHDDSEGFICDGGPIL